MATAAFIATVCHRQTHRESACHKGSMPFRAYFFLRLCITTSGTSISSMLMPPCWKVFL